VSTGRDALVAEVLAAGREVSTAAVMFHTAVGALAGLSVTETKALEVVHRAGPLTPADLARHTGLAPASVTALLDRLERKQVARRVPHPTDGRRTLVEVEPAHLERQYAVFADLVHRLEELNTRFTDDELAVVLRWLRGAAARQLAATQQLTDDTAS
jgi:DNA-binding MarR family transcriptional regulator